MTQIGFSILLIASSADILGRHFMAISQKVERDPYPVIAWLEDALPSDNYLLSGHSIGYYAMDHTKHCGFIVANIPPYHYDFSTYSDFYIVTEKPIDGMNLVGSYRTERGTTHFDSKTYHSLYLMNTSDRDDYLKILKIMDDKSRESLKSN